MKLPRYVEVETSRYCNRQCEWCPNHPLGDRKVQEFLNWADLERVLYSLARVDYEGWFAFHNYNEPLANPRLLDELALVRALVPAAKPTVFTNGDRLTGKLYSDLVSAGLSQMRVTVYPKRWTGREPSHETLRAWLKRRAFLPDKFWTEVTARQGPALLYSGEPEIILISPRIDRYYDRGGTIPWLSVESRTTPCLLTASSLSIDYEGNIKMCCNVVTGNRAHRNYMLGNVRDNDIIDIWNSVRFETLRDRHARADWTDTSICKTCRQELGSTINGA